jgi:hypothetical protein
MFTQSSLIVIITGHGPWYESVQAAFEGRMASFHRDVVGLVSLPSFHGIAITDCVDSVRPVRRKGKHVH